MVAVTRDMTACMVAGLCIQEVAGMGLMAWPMAALTDDAEAASQIVSKLAIGPERRLVQVLRLGEPSGDQTPRARRPISELIG